MTQIYAIIDENTTKIPDVRDFLYDRMVPYRNKQFPALDVPRIARLIGAPRQKIYAAFAKNKISVALARKLHSLDGSGFELSELLPYMV